MYFPSFFDEAEILTFYSHLKNKLLLDVAVLLDEATEETHRKLEEIDLFLARFNLPENFDYDSPENCLRVLEISFANICAMLEQNGTPQAQDLTVFNFYARLDYMKKMAARAASQAQKG